ncbi:MAG TPA: helix-turn-helix domain-containing protein [Terriglobales bacterium]|nr:helix-turn-helix domain-containing protein [Terriglobales bacterium]
MKHRSKASSPSASTTTAESFAPKQARSKSTLNRLMAATARVIEKHGMAKTTVALIAKEAGMSPTVVYRRFRDKNALLEAVFVHMMETQERALSHLTGAQLMRGLSLQEFTKRTFRSLLAAYGQRGNFLGAARQFARVHGKPSFLRRVEEFEKRAFQHAVAMMLERRDEIAHPKPGEAVAIGLLAVISAIRELSFWSANSKRELFPADEQLLAQLTLLFFAYLKCERPCN